MSIVLSDWINKNTKGHQTVVEFGSMFFDKLSHVDCPNKIGIEIWKPYIDKATYHNCKKIHGDFRQFESLISKEDMDCAMFIDTLEHLTAEDAKDLMGRVMQQFNKVILFIPEGLHELTHDHFKMGADIHQTHKSTWYEKDLKDLGFTDITVVPDFHHKSTIYTNNDTGAMFAVWNKP